MKLAITALVICLALCGGCNATTRSNHPKHPTLPEFLKIRGEPVVVAEDYQLRKTSFRTITLYGLDISRLSRLIKKSDRILVYTSDLRFSQHAEHHFAELLERKERPISTMFATLLWGTPLVLVRFDGEGRFISEESITIDIAYFETAPKRKP